MSMSFENSASISDGPALKTFVENLAGATALAKSPDATPSTAWACVTFPKYPSRTSAGGAERTAVVPPLRHPGRSRTRPQPAGGARAGRFDRGEGGPLREESSRRHPSLSNPIGKVGEWLTSSPSAGIVPAHDARPANSPSLRSMPPTQLPRRVVRRANAFRSPPISSPIASAVIQGAVSCFLLQRNFLLRPVSSSSLSSPRRCAPRSRRLRS